MPEVQKPRLLSVEGGLALLVAIFAAASDMTWGLRALFVICGFGLIGHLVWRIPRHVITRTILGLIGAALLLSVTWQPIWDDFSKKHPSLGGFWIKWVDLSISDSANFVAQTPVSLTLVLIGISILGWGWHPVWMLRHRTVSVWRRTLDQKVWLVRNAAIDLVRRSRWGSSRRSLAEPPKPAFSLASLGLPQIDPAARTRSSMFYNWCSLVLDQFEQVNKIEVRAGKDEKEYDEDALNKWLESRYEEDIIAEFGNPY
jgi:hypothetical protein